MIRTSMSRSLVAVCLATSVGASGVALAAEPPGSMRTDHRRDGNRIAVGTGPLTVIEDIAIDRVPSWVLASPAAPGSDWVIGDAEGEAAVLTPDGSLEAITGIGAAGIPEVVLDEAGELAVRDARAASAAFADVLPGARVVTAAGGTRAVLTGPTDRYPHGVLGDALEAGSLTLVGPDSATRVVEIEADAVIEGLAPIAVDLDGDGVEELVVTISDDSVGARLRVYATDGSLTAESDPIGQGFRWRHQIAAGPTGPAGEVEVSSIRTPHIGGIVEAFQLRGDRLELVATASGFSSHRIGSPNLDMALLADADGDGRLELIAPADDMTRLGVLRRVGDGFELVAWLPLDGRLATNVAAVADSEGRLVLAAGTADGRLRIFR